LSGRIGLRARAGGVLVGLVWIAPVVVMGGMWSVLVAVEMFGGHVSLRMRSDSSHCRYSWGS
jgi:hypothetical protein